MNVTEKLDLFHGSCGGEALRLTRVLIPPPATKRQGSRIHSPCYFELSLAPYELFGWLDDFEQLYLVSSYYGTPTASTKPEYIYAPAGGAGTEPRFLSGLPGRHG